jgi:hypothetical protein
VAGTDRDILKINLNVRGSIRLVLKTAELFGEGWMDLNANRIVIGSFPKTD